MSLYAQQNPTPTPTNSDTDTTFMLNQMYHCDIQHFCTVNFSNKIIVVNMHLRHFMYWYNQNIFKHKQL